MQMTTPTPSADMRCPSCWLSPRLARPNGMSNALRAASATSHRRSHLSAITPATGASSATGRKVAATVNPVAAIEPVRVKTCAEMAMTSSHHPRRAGQPRTPQQAEISYPQGSQHRPPNPCGIVFSTVVLSRLDWVVDHQDMGRQLRALRTAAGRTVASVAADAGLSVPYVANLENGRGNPTTTAL